MASSGERGKLRLIGLLLLVGIALVVRTVLRNRAREPAVKAVPSQELLDGGAVISCRGFVKGATRQVEIRAASRVLGHVTHSFSARRTDRRLDGTYTVEYVFHEVSVYPAGTLTPPPLEVPIVVDHYEGKVVTEHPEAQDDAIAMLAANYDGLCASLPIASLQVGSEVPELSKALDTPKLHYRVVFERFVAAGQRARFRIDPMPVDAADVTFETPDSFLVVDLPDGTLSEMRWTTRVREKGHEVWTETEYRARTP